MPARIFTDDELARIQEAVAATELRTSGEIVPYVVDRSGTYEVAIWRGASLVAVMVMLAAVVVMRFYTGWGLAWLHTGWGLATLAVGAGTLGALLAAYVPALRRLFAGEARLTRRVHRRASLAFLEEEVFLTRERTGILLFVSLFEHRIEVVADRGINERVRPERWLDIVALVRDGIRQGHLANGLVAAIGKCGDLLEEKGFSRTEEDRDELSDALRYRQS
jgi:putative membrane protein